MDWTTAMERWVVAQRGSGSPRTTIRTRTQHLRQLAVAYPDRSPWALTAEDLLSWAAAHDWAPETRHSVRTTLRSFYGWAADAGHVLASPAAKLPRVRRTAPRPRPLPDGIYADAFRRAGKRERLIMRLAAEAGMRRGEIAQAATWDLMDDLDGWSLEVHGKGGKTRIVPLTEGLALELLALPPGYFFPGKDHGHLSAQHVGDLISALLPAGWTLHHLRHRFATRAYAVDRDVFTFQALLGHASADTTRRYVRPPQGAARRLVAAIASP